MCSLSKKRGFSYYNIEQFLREAGAERINEKAVVTFEEELRSMANELINEAEMYAKYAGRKKVITNSDIDMVKSCRIKHVYVRPNPVRKLKHVKIKSPVQKPVINLRME